MCTSNKTGLLLGFPHAHHLEGVYGVNEILQRGRYRLRGGVWHPYVIVSGLHGDTRTVVSLNGATAMLGRCTSTR